MRSCLVDKVGNERWEDDDRPEPADTIHVVVQKEIVRHYTFTGNCQIRDQVFRRYQEIITEVPQ